MIKMADIDLKFMKADRAMVKAMQRKIDVKGAQKRRAKEAKKSTGTKKANG